jgi:replicative DNA helicase
MSNDATLLLNEDTLLLNEDAEKALLGCIIRNPSMFHETRLIVGAEDFFIVRHGWIWDAIRSLVDSGATVDYITVCDALRQRGQLDEAGGAAYLTHLLTQVETSFAAPSYAEIVQREADKRKLAEAASEVVESVHRGHGTLDDIQGAARLAIANACKRRLMKRISTAGDMASRFYDIVEERYMSDDKHFGVPTGFSGVDHILGGMQRTDLLIVAGRPGTGKTSLLLNVALRAAVAQHRVLFFSIEMAEEQLMMRLSCQIGGFTSDKLRRGVLDGDEWERFVSTIARVSKLPLIVEDTPGQTVEAICDVAHVIHTAEPVDLILVDYLQKAGIEAAARMTRTQAVDNIASRLKQLARELHVPVLAAAQLSRAIEQRRDKKPQLSDLREGGNIEQEADVVMFLWRPDPLVEQIVQLLIEKHRNGPTGGVDLLFQEQYTRFVDAPRVP